MEALQMTAGLQFIKLGGSLITEKNRPHTPRQEILDQLAGELARTIQEHPEIKLVLGHGSGSFGHVPAKKFGTRQGVHSSAEWYGFVEVWREAAALNKLVVEAFQAQGLPALAFPPSAAILAQDGKVSAWNLAPIQAALDVGLLPVVYGDVVFDSVRGGTILSTEDLFGHLASQLNPTRIILLGIEPGVWADFPICQQVIPEITPLNFPELRPLLHGSAATDVTGGMLTKVEQSLKLVSELPGLEVLILSGEGLGTIERVLTGERVGTIIHS